MKSSTCIHYSLRTAYKYIVVITFGVCSVTNKNNCLVPRPSHRPVFDRLQSEFIGASLSEPHIWEILYNYASSGADPDIEEGGGIHIEWGLVRRAL